MSDKMHADHPTNDLYSRKFAGLILRNKFR